MAAAEQAKETNKIKWRQLIVWTIVWTIVGLSFGFRTYFFNARLGFDISLASVVSSYLIDFYLWGLASPLIFFLCRRFPIERRNFLSHAGLHILSGLVLIPVVVLLSIPLYWYLGFPDPNHIRSIDQLFSKIVMNPITLHESLLAYSATLIVAHAILYYRRARDRETQAAQLAAQTARLSEQLVQAQLSALKMQLHPHFLFNTLNSIASLLHKDPETAHRMISRLSDFLRMTLKNSETHSVTLERELEFLNTYLEIEKIRFQDRLIVEMRIEPAARGAQVPNLILQPIVENAVRHGLANVEADGLLRISAVRVNGSVLIEIDDNGPGFGRGGRKKTTGGGVGLVNTRARLEQFYGADFSFEIAEKADSPGTRVSLEVPFRQRGETEAQLRITNYELRIKN
jgi:two-component system, LytTR family, sensor kinase